MNLLERLYHDHASLLTSRGFDEHGPNGPFHNPSLLQGLKQNIVFCLRNEDADGLSRGFSLKAAASFNDQEATAVYELHYRYDPLQQDLDLFQVDLTWGVHQSKIKLKTSYELPTAKRIYESLKRETGLLKSRGKPVRLVIPRKINRRSKRL